MPSEKLLVERILNHDDDCWKKFILEYSNFIYAAVVHFTRDYDEKMSIFLHILEKLRENDFRKLRDFQFRSSLSTWVTVVSRNMALDCLRSQYGRDFRYKDKVQQIDERIMHMESLIDRESPHVILEEEERRNQLVRMQAALSKVFSFLEDRDVLLLKMVFFHGMKIRKAGKLLKIRSVYKHLQRTLSRVKILLLEHAEVTEADWRIFVSEEQA